jgi:hypothetical protein
VKIDAAAQLLAASFGRHFAADKLMLRSGSRNFAGATT